MARAVANRPLLERRTLAERMRSAARAQGLRFHDRPGRFRRIPLASLPWVVTFEQKRFLATLVDAVEAATRRVWSFRRARPEVRALLPLAEAEERWMLDALGDGPLPPQTFFGRLDAVGDLWSPRWRDSLRLIEANLTGVGGVYYSFVASRIVHELFAPWLAGPLSGWRLDAEEDAIDLLDLTLRRHADRIGLRRRNVALVEERANLRGPCEFEPIAEILCSRGRHVRVADPSDLHLRRGELRLGDEPIDLVYRDPTLADLLEMEAEGTDLEPMREAFRRNRVVSGITGDLDHKALIEVLADERLLGTLSPPRAALLRRHLAWTRVVREARTTDPRGGPIDLLPWIARRRESLVLKPNRDYGGREVRIGRDVSAAAWDAAVAAALRDPGSFVVQEYRPLPRMPYPVLDAPRGRSVSLFQVLGFAAVGSRSLLLGRAGPEPVVNLTRGGAIAGVLRASPRRRARDLPPLLDRPVHRLGLRLRGSMFEPLIRRLGAELRARGIRLRPHFYLSDSYGCVINTCNIGLKWVEAIGQVPDLRRRFAGLVRPPRDVMRTLRHEAGHAFCYVHRLFRRTRFRRLFEVRGSFYGTYPDRGWTPDAAARRRFREGRHVHLFCLKHPDEDFANTFAVWLDPASRWQSRFRDRPVALEKLHFVEELVRRYGRRPYRNDPRDLDAPLAELRYPAGTYLTRERRHRPGSNYLPDLGKVAREPSTAPRRKR